MAITLGAAGGGGLYGGVLEEIVLNQSQTWVPHRNGTVAIYVVGAGGAGGKRQGGTDCGMATGGGAGGFCIKEALDVTTSGSFTVTIGAGGAATYSSTQNVTGVAGGNSTVAGTGLSATLTANGGAGGGFISGENNAGVAGGAGGTASNGDYNRTGGRGGSVDANLGSAAVRIGTGGGAVAIKSATGFHGGDYKAGGGVGNDTIFGTGGAGIGGNGGGKIASGNPNQSWGLGGGGANYAAYNWLAQENVYAGNPIKGHPDYKTFEFKGASLIEAKYGVAGIGGFGNSCPATNAGGTSTSSNVDNDNRFYSVGNDSSDIGCGGGGHAGGTTIVQMAGFGSAFAGGGGNANASRSDGDSAGRTTGTGGCGGGGGGFFVGQAGGGYSNAAGNGGDGLIIIHYTAYA
tara:strand:- start:2179 stop:3387 length:1209 start_codon:yes stop_codon:yes gene_type:complete